MDPRSHLYFHHHHHSGYAPPPPNPITNPVSYSQNPNFYSFSSNHHHSFHLSHLRPPPPQQPHPPLPSPPISQRWFLRSDNSQFLHNANPNSDFLLRHDGFRPNYRDECPRHLLPDFESEMNNRPDFRDRLGRDWVPGSSRLVDDEERLDRRGRDRSPRDFRVVPVNGYEGRRGFLGDDIDDRRVHDREMLRDLRESYVVNGSNESVDGVQIFSEKVEFYSGRDGDLEFQRHGSRGSREGSHEYNRTPRKQLQKKSAFLRIQKPSYKSREDERVHYLGHFNDAKSSSFRGKDLNLKSESGAAVVGKREGSPVELDVSFKSNSLVAKAILAPSSTSACVSDVGLVHRNSKIRKVLIPDKDSVRLLPSKLSDGIVRLENSVPSPKGAFSSDNCIEQSWKDAKASACDGTVMLEDSVTAPKSASSSCKGIKQSSKDSLKDVKASACNDALKVEYPLTAPKSASNSSKGCKHSSKDAKASACDGTVKLEDTGTAPKSSYISDKGVKQLPKDAKASACSGAAKLEDYVTAPKSALPSDKDIKQSLRDAKASTCDGSSLAGSGTTSFLVRKDKADVSIKGSSLAGSGTTSVSSRKDKGEKSVKGSVSSEGVNNVVPGKDTKLRAVKRKKIVKRVVKKVVNPKLSSSNLQPVKECDTSVERVSSSHDPPASSQSANAGTMSLSCILDSHQPWANEATVLRSFEVEESTKVPVVEQVGSGCFNVPNTKRKRSCPTSPSSPSILEETEIGGCLVNGSTIKDLVAVSRSLENITECRNEISSSAGDGAFGNQFCNDGGPFFTGNDIRGGSPKALHFLEGNTGLGLLSTGNTGICEAPATLHGTNLVVESGLANQQKEKTLSGIEISADGLFYQRNLPVENSGKDQFGNDRVLAESSKIFVLSVSGEPVTQNVAISADSYNHGANRITGSEDDFTNTERNNSSSNGISEGISLESSADTFPLLVKSASFRKSLCAIFSVDASKEDTCLVKSNNECTKASHLDLSRSEVKDACPPVVNMDDSTQWVDTTLRLSFKDRSQAESEVSGDTGLQHSKDGIDVLPQSGSTELSDDKFSIGNTFDVVHNGTLPKNKKMKFSPDELEISSPMGSGNEGPITADASVFGVEVSHICNGQAKGEEVTVSSMDRLSIHLDPLSDCVFGLPESAAKGNLKTKASLRDAFGGDSLKGVRTCPTAEGLSAPKPQMPFQLEGINMQITDVIPMLDGRSHQSCSVDFENGKGGKMDVNDAEEKLVYDGTNTNSRGSLGLQSQDSGRSPSKAEENDGYDSEKNDLFLSSNCCCPSVDGDGRPAANSGDELTVFVPDTGFDEGSPEKLPIVPGPPLCQASVENICQGDNIVGEKPAPQVSRSPQVSYSLNPKTSRQDVELNDSINRKVGSLLLQDLRNNTHVQCATSAEVHRRNTQPTQSVSSTYAGNLSLAFSVSRKVASSTYIAKHRTWHRTDNFMSSGNSSFSSNVSMQRQLPKTGTSKFQSTSYIRKGNSLVRKASPVVTQSLVSHGFSHGRQPGSSGTHETKNSAGAEHAIVAVDTPNVVRMGGLSSSFERPRTPPLPLVPKVTKCIANSIGNCVSSVEAEPLHELSTGTASVPLEVTDHNQFPRSLQDVSRLSETSLIQADPVNSLECQSEQHGGNSVLSNVERITYVKQKSNQLVASSSLNAEAHNRAASASGNYYKRIKHQLIRHSVDGHAKLKSSTYDGSWNLEGQVALNIPSMGFERLLCKVSTKTYKPSKFSLVWTLRGSQSSKPLHNKVLQQLFPWKRVTYWRNFSRDLTSRKWMLFRNRDALYTRSRHGFSLQKLKGLGVRGSSLKWSKSMEKHSKKASEEATLAVAAAERKKREQKGEHIFRIGSVRYKMDSSRHTLQRISDDDTSCSASLQEEKEGKKPYVPRRLVIGKHEYVRVGNGNQLVRDPKQRTRILASEKVRWSLHTVRSRLAKKRKYCQFFTRFGKCNKDNGKCPYMHDPSKIAVCTKFLNGLCSNSDCKLTHKVIPERMPDCSYYLQGLCNNRSCPYRHVHVDPDASTCEGFLRGYCAAGNECQKKHSYVCPIYEATESCPQGSKCKLHHPKIRSKGKKIKQSQEKNAQMRYFGSMHLNHLESGVAVSGKQSIINDGDRFEGDTPDFISIGMSDEEVMENDYLADQRTNLSGSDSMNIHLCDLDELIKPICIMNI